MIIVFNVKMIIRYHLIIKHAIITVNQEQTKKNKENIQIKVVSGFVNYV